MPALGALTTFSAGLILRSEHNGNWAALRTWADNSVVLTDVAKTISASHTFSAAQTFSSTINGQTISSAATFTGTLTAAGAITGLSLTVGGAAATFRSVQYVTGSTLRWVASANSDAEAGANAGSNYRLGRYDDAGAFVDYPIAIARSTGIVTLADGLVVTASGLTVSAGGLAVTGNSTITGNLIVTGTFSAPGVVTASVLASDATTTSVTPANTAMAVALGSNQTWRIDFDLSINCDNTGGVVLNFTAPAGATGQVAWLGNTSSHTAVYGRAANAFSTVQTWSTFNSSGAVNGVMVRASVYIATSATSGSLTLQVSSGVVAQTSKVLSGSTILATRIT